MNLHIICRKKGLTLAEVLIALALLTLAVGGILGVLFQNMSTGQSIDRTYVANVLAKNRIERLREIRRDKGYTALTGMPGTTVETIDRNGNSDVNGDYQRTTLIQPDSGTKLTTVTVTVKYKRGGSLMPASMQLVTLISEYVD